MNYTILAVIPMTITTTKGANIFTFFSPKWADKVKRSRSHDKNVAWTRNGPGMVPTRQEEYVCMLDTTASVPNIWIKICKVSHLKKKHTAKSAPRGESCRLFGSLLYSKQRQDTSYKTNHLTCIFFWSPYPSITCYETHSLIHNR